MFFYVKYIDLDDFQKTEELESMADQLTDVFPKENKQLLVNPNCFIGIILDYVFDAAGIDEDIRCDFDISTEKGKAVNVNLYPPDNNAIEIFAEKAVYYIIYNDKLRDCARPLLSISSKEYKDFIECQRRRSSIKRRRSRSKASRPSLSTRPSLSIKGSKYSSKSLKSATSKSKQSTSLL